MLEGCRLLEGKNKVKMGNSRVLQSEGMLSIAHNVYGIMHIM